MNVGTDIQEFDEDEFFETEIAPLMARIKSLAKERGIPVLLAGISKIITTEQDGKDGFSFLTIVKTYLPPEHTSPSLDLLGLLASEPEIADKIIQGLSSRHDL